MNIDPLSLMVVWLEGVVRISIAWLDVQRWRLAAWFWKQLVVVSAKLQGQEEFEWEFLEDWFE